MLYSVIPRALLQVVTVEPGGHTRDHSRKIRLLLVTLCRPVIAALSSTLLRANQSIQEDRPKLRGAHGSAAAQNYGEHGRELITVEVALRLLQTLADPSAELQIAERLRGGGRPDLHATLHNTVFKVLQEAPPSAQEAPAL